MSRFVVLRGLKEGNVFWSGMNEDDTEETVRYLNDGTLAYEVIGIFDNADDAQQEWAKHSPWGAFI